MKGIKLGFNFADFAKQRGMGIGSFKLKDGSSVKILNGINSNATDFYQVKDGYLLGGKGFRGENTMQDIAACLDNIKLYAQNPNDVTNAWHKSFEVIA